MKFDKYYEARNVISEIIKTDLLGPVEENEILEEMPVSYYLLGKIYPRYLKTSEEMEENESEFSDGEVVSLGNGNFPSAMGITFSISDDAESFLVNADAARYESDENETKWKRIPVQGHFLCSVEELRKTKMVSYPIDDKFHLQVSLYDKKCDGEYKITATLVNDFSSEDLSYRSLSGLTYFQPHLQIGSLSGGEFCHLYNASIGSSDQETLELELLYHNVCSYAVGHGCSANWEINQEKKVERVYLEIIPEYELLQMKASNCIDSKLLSMNYIANASIGDIENIIDALTSGYAEWIVQQKKAINTLDDYLMEVAKSNVLECKQVWKRLCDVKEIMKNEDVLQAFKYANQTMLEQRLCTVGRQNVEDISDIKWYPFQLAFILLEIESIVCPNSEARKKVDLLWFPTGGGKTEAYLGIAAFTIFYRRIKLLREGNVDEGVAVFMRYTLRLLSFQQFERAATMICAAEKIRRDNKISGKEFGIGMWVGSSLSPNSLKDANDYLQGKTKDNTSPVQMKKCPWCHSQLNDTDYEVNLSEKRMKIRCPQNACFFHEGLPIHLIDEDIYMTKPSFIIGTIDKFAQIAFKEEAGELLGVDLPYPPELIIQDELHLISGPLGTITGVYEAAITKLCEKNGVKPKIIASTATIKNAKEQINCIYGMDYAQFPPQGLSIEDSYFAKLSCKDEKASRKYMGILSAGSSRALTFTRTMGALLFASRYLIDAGYEEDVIDSFWTETGYFNTLRELGSSLARIVDSVQDRYQYLKNNKFKEKYPLKNSLERYDRYFELTSRQNSNNLGEAIQNNLLIKYTKNNTTKPYDFLVASNMISVGVDVARLNNMLVVGQPIKTSEYIQSTSRVGRSTPGLVVVTYHPSLARDRSFYEQFTQFHSSLYKYVEATSLTPFSDRARDRALQALYVILCRYSIPVLRDNKGAAKFHSQLAGLDKVRDYILEYAKIVDPDEVENIRKEINDIEVEWEEAAKRHDDLVYWNYIGKENTLFQEDYMEGNRFRMMNSMRSVEAAVNVFVEE